MAIAAGTCLGPYEVLSRLGAGGMGEVYRARDTRLSREVAIKVLPATFSEDADRLRRFEQEARATSALNHPNILTIYDIGTHNNTPYIVAELLEGAELRAQLNQGAIAQRQAIDYAQQIAQGLSAAHEKGITHRDLKPENLFITSDGRVKILDFGLAKLRQPKPGEPVNTDAPTNAPQTDPGAVLGTVGYMSPEQVRGQDTDHRADIFSFGVILYEMLSGRRAFRGESLAETMAAIVKDEPPDLAESGRVSPQLEHIVRRCLAKKPERRFQSTSDLSFAFEVLSAPSGSGLEAAALPVVTERTAMARLFGQAPLAWLVSAALLLAVFGFAWAYFARQMEADARVFRTSLLPPEKLSFGSFAVSPDGKWLAFAAATGGNQQLWVRALDSMEAKAMAGTEGGESPFWSPDSRFIGFFTSDSLKKIEVSGGPVQTLANVKLSYGGAWNRDEVIIFARPGGISQVSAAGGKATPVVESEDQRELFRHQFPSFLPDGRHFLYLFRSREKESRGIYLGSLDGIAPRRLLDENSNAVYAASPSGAGWLLFARESSLLAQPFDPQRLQLGGEPLAVAEQVARAPGTSRASFSVSDNGLLVCDMSGNTERQLHWVNRGGSPIGSLNVPGVVSSPWLSPDEKRFVVDRRDPQTGFADIWLYDVSSGNGSRFTFDPANDIFPVWSSDGSRIVWSSNREGQYHLYQKAASGAGQDRLLLRSEYSRGIYAEDWPQQGRAIIYHQPAPKTKFDLLVLPVGPLSGNQPPIPFLQTEVEERGGRLSPDGQWMAYVSDESGQYEVYIQSFPKGGSKRQVSTSGGIGPHWRRDGKELFYYSADGKLMAVAVVSGASVETLTPVALFAFRSGSRASPTGPPYTMTADGQQFLINAIVEAKESAPLTLVVNWLAEMKK
jgi:Tol biopolymer transport system component